MLQMTNIKGFLVHCLKGANFKAFTLALSPSPMSKYLEQWVRVELRKQRDIGTAAIRIQTEKGPWDTDGIQTGRLLDKREKRGEKKSQDQLSGQSIPTSSKRLKARLGLKDIYSTWNDLTNVLTKMFKKKTDSVNHSKHNKISFVFTDLISEQNLMAWR